MEDTPARRRIRPRGGWSDLDALAGYEVDDAAGGQHVEPVEPTFTVTNPPGSVTVSTFVDGSVQRVDLAQKVTAMTEADLAEEIVVIARLATQDARAAQYAYMLDEMRQQGHDDPATRDFLSESSTCRRRRMPVPLVRRSSR